MFQFPGFASGRNQMTAIADGRVSPFGHLGITACVPLPQAFRSLPRPSSPPCAQASPTGLRSLDHKFVMKQSTYDLQLLFARQRVIHCWMAHHETESSVRIHYPTITATSVVKQHERADEQLY